MNNGAAQGAAAGALTALILAQLPGGGRPSSTLPPPDKFIPTTGQTEFVLSRVPVQPDYALVTVNGVIYTRNADFVLTANKLLWTGFALSSVTPLIVYYVGG